MNIILAALITWVSSQGSLQYDALGIYTIGFHCLNDATPLGVQFNTKVQVLAWQTSSFHIKPTQMQEMDGSVPTSDLIFQLNLVGLSRPPGGIQAHFHYGDGSPDEVFPLTTLTPGHRYPARGIYHGNVTLSDQANNSVSLNFKARVGVFQVSVAPTTGLVNTQEFEFLTAAAIPLYWVTIQINVSDSVTLELDTGLNGIGYFLRHTFAEVGTFYPTFYGRMVDPYNVVYTEIGPYGNSPLVVTGAVDDTLELSVDQDIVLVSPGIVVATVFLRRSQPGIASMFCDFDFDEPLEPTPQNWTGTLDALDSFSVTFQYKSLGSHTLKVNCSNPISHHLMSQIVFIFHPCFSDDPVFDLQYNFNNPLMSINAARLRIVTRTIIMCPWPSFMWWVNEITPEGDTVDISLTQANKDFIEFAPGELEPALYRWVFYDW